MTTSEQTGATLTTLTDVWSVVFGRTVTADDDFFACGGTSLLAARLTAELRARFGINLPYRTVVSAGTPRRLLDALDSDRSAPMLPVTSRARSGLSVQQQAIWLLEQLGTGSIGYNSLTQLHLRGPLDRARLASALAAVADRHPAVRWRFPLDEDGMPTPMALPVTTPRLSVVDYPDAPTALVREAGQHAFDLTRESPVRWTLLRLADDDHLLLQVEHHFAHDGWSMWILLEDLANAYRGVVDLGTDTTSYADYCSWQHAWLRSADAEAQLRYWAGEIGPPGPPLSWPGEHRRLARFPHLGGTHQVRLPNELQSRVAAFARDARATPFAVLMAAYAALVGAVCENEAPVLGTMMRNRRLPGVDRTVGMFVNTVAFGYGGWAGHGLAELSRQTTERLAAGMDHQEIPFPMVASHLGAARDPSRNPIFQTSFSMNDWPDTTLDFGPELAVDVSFPSSGGAKFDIDVVVLPEHRGTTLLWRYSEPLFTHTEAVALARRYLVLLDRGLAAGASPVGTLLERM
jgi:hypothetical protein